MTVNKILLNGDASMMKSNTKNEAITETTLVVGINVRAFDW